MTALPDIAFMQLECRVGAVSGNVDRMISCYREEADRRDLVVFPELSVTGYPPEDLLCSESYLHEAAEQLERLALATQGRRAALLAGAPERAADGALYNAVYVLLDGRIAQIFRKRRLPNVGVFDEARYFTPERDDVCDVFTAPNGARVRVLICEELWRNPPEPTHPADVIVGVNASPWRRAKHAARLAAATRRVRQEGLPLIYGNAFGAQDDLIFDGGSFALRADGSVAAHAPHFEEARLIVTDAMLQCRKASENTGGTGAEIRLSGPADGTAEAPVNAAFRHDTADLAAALTLAIHRYVTRNGFSRAVIGLSGGLDSALVAALAAEALGGGNVSCVYLPSCYSSIDSERDARACAEALGTGFEVIPIEGMMAAARHELDRPDRAEFARAPLAVENIQPRLRGMILMALSAARGELLLATGNKSELATGYCTLYGDMCGGYAPLKDVYKTEAYALSRFLNARAGRELIPASVLLKAPTAELRFNQKDSDSLPPYERLDAMLTCFIERRLSLPEVIARGYRPEEAARTERLLRISEFKRRQAAPGPNVSMCAFGRERRMPMSRG